MAFRNRHLSILHPARGIVDISEAFIFAFTHQE